MNRIAVQNLYYLMESCDAKRSFSHPNIDKKSLPVCPIWKEQGYFFTHGWESRDFLSLRSDLCPDTERGAVTYIKLPKHLNADISGSQQQLQRPETEFHVMSFLLEEKPR